MSQTFTAVKLAPLRDQFEYVFGWQRCRFNEVQHRTLIYKWKLHLQLVCACPQVHSFAGSFHVWATTFRFEVVVSHTSQVLCYHWLIHKKALGSNLHILLHFIRISLTYVYFGFRSIYTRHLTRGSTRGTFQGGERTDELWTRYGLKPAGVVDRVLRKDWTCPVINTYLVQTLMQKLMLYSPCKVWTKSRICPDPFAKSCS